MLRSVANGTRCLNLDHMSNCGLYAINDWVCRLIVYNSVFDLQRSNLSNLTCYIPL